MAITERLALERPMHGRHEKGAGSPLWKRMTWLVVIWAGSVLALGFVAWLLRQAMNAAGLTTP